jgi:two-component system sensor histidine kinase QseC
LRTEPVALAALAAGVWAPLADRVRERQLTVRTEVATDLTVHADRALLRLVVANLLTNAAEYTPAAGVVQVTGRLADGGFEFCVANPAGDLRAEDLPRLFERFWRKDPARSGAEHHGLGLPLAQAAAKALGLSLTAGLSDGILCVKLYGKLAQ